MKRIHDRHIIELDIHLVNVLANIFCGSAHTRILAKERSASGPPAVLFRTCLKPRTEISQSLNFSLSYITATTKKRYSDTTIQRYTEPEPELEPCINYANYCPQSPRETSVIIFSGGGRAHIPKDISYKVKMRKVIVCKAPLHQMIACRALSMFNRLKYWHAQSDNLAYFLTYYVVDNNICINCVQDHFTT